MAKRASSAADAINAIFGAATSLPPTVATSAGRKPKRDLFKSAAYDDYARFCATVVAVDSMVTKLRDKMETQMIKLFAAAGCRKKAKPDSMDAEGDQKIGEGVITFGKRSTMSVLSPEEVAFLKTYRLPVDVQTIVPELWAIPPVCVNDPEMLQRYAVALHKAGLPPLVRQDAVTKTVVCDDTISTLFADYADKPEVVEAVLPVVSQLGFRSTLAEGHTSMEAVEFALKELRQQPELAEKAARKPSDLTKEAEAMKKARRKLPTAA